MEVKEWSYEEYPSFDEPIDGVERIPTTGDEKGAYIFSNVEYAHVDGITLLFPEQEIQQIVMKHILV